MKERARSVASTRRTWAVLCTTAVTCVGACAGTGASDVADRSEMGAEVAVQAGAPPVPDQPVSGLLYVAQAGAAAIEGDGAEVAVTLTGTDTEVLWFQDRPGRGAGEMRMSSFVDQWEALGFAADPPNAVIRHDGDGPGGLGTVVEMRDPTWEQPNGALRFTAVLAAGAGELPALMSDVSLFIDDGGSTYHPVTLQVTNAAPEETIGVQIAGAEANGEFFSTGQPGASDSAIELSADGGSLPLSSVVVSDSEVRLETASPGSGTSVAFSVRLFVVAPQGGDTLRLLSEAPAGVQLSLSVPGSPPQVLVPGEVEVRLGP